MVSALPDRILVTPVRAEDTAELSEMLNAIIVRGGSTAYEEPFTADRLAAAMLTGPNVLRCVVARDEQSGSLLGFQTLYRSDALPDGVVDIATFTRPGLTRRGVGSALFAMIRRFATNRGLRAINATIRADNISGLAFYSKLGFVDHHIQHGVPLKTGQLVDRVCKRFTPLSTTALGNLSDS
jgi:GNAT superfamily N-acetyltransferase